ncbi:MAG: hypothetical protein ACTHJR_11165 [Sphingomonas sp.]|uniref:hypothetical protein n=1 Tax=Sphingomonas sp. TaxID=28214 RepID=UPI003F80757B
MIGLVALVPLLLATQAAADRPQVPDGPPPDRIVAGQTGPWGSSERNWSIDRSGAVTLSYRDQPLKGGGDKVPVTHVVRFSAGPQGFAAVRAILLPIERSRGPSYRCLQPITDAGSAGVGWVYGARIVNYGLDSGCLDRPGDPGWGPFQEADRRIDAMAAAATDRVTEDRP